MNDMIKLILSLSLSGSLLAVFLFIIKPLIKHRLSKTVQYYIWIIILLRMVLPFSFEDSLMNEVFYRNQVPTAPITQPVEVEFTVENKTQASVLTPSNTDSVQNHLVEFKNIRFTGILKDVWNRVALIIWLLGTIMVFMISFQGYIRFIKQLKMTNKPALAGEHQLLFALLSGSRGVRLFRNPRISTPMLIGIVRPIIVIPDDAYDDIQLKNILLHEIAHLKGMDIIIKWLTMVVASMHWYNPLMSFIRKEINRACELSCDERVIRTLNVCEKQAYGNTLISVVAEYKCPIGVLQATMCEEKKSLKERLISIMNHNKKSKLVMSLSAVLLIFVLLVAVRLGAGVGTKPDKTAIDGVPQDSTYNLIDIYAHRTPYVGNNSKVSAIVMRLPVPDTYFKQQFFSLKTNERPYGLTVYHEPVEINTGIDATKISELMSIGSSLEITLWKNSLVLFCMIDNLEEVTFAFRFSESDGRLESSKYDTVFSFSRADVEEKYGDLSVLAENLHLLHEALIDKKDAFKGLELYVWRNHDLTGNNNLYFTLLPGTNINKSSKQIYDMEAATSDLEIIKEELSQYREGTYLFITHSQDIDKETMDGIGYTLSDVMTNGVISIGGFQP